MAGNAVRDTHRVKRCKRRVLGRSIAIDESALPGLSQKTLGVGRGEDIAADQQLPDTGQTFDAGIDDQFEKDGREKEDADVMTPNRIGDFLQR